MKNQHKEQFRTAIIAAVDKDYQSFKTALSDPLESNLINTLKHITSEKAKSVFFKEG